MKALKILRPGYMEIVEEEMPVLQSEDEVLIKIAYSGICKSDIELLEGTHPHLVNKNAALPLIPGHEWSGIVYQTGKNVSEFKPGDKVVGDVSLGCGCCEMCKEGHFNLCPTREVIGSYKNRQGSFAEYLRTHKRSIYKLPDGLSLRDAAAIEPAATAAYTARRSKVQYGDRVLVIGDGSIGLFCVQCAKAFGAAEVVLVGSWPEKLEIAKKTGADIGLSYRFDDVDTELTRYTDSKGLFDVVMETSGNASAIERAIRYVKPTGVIGMVSFYSDAMMVKLNDVIVKDAELHGILGSLNTFAPTLSSMAAGMIDPKPLITQDYDFKDVAQAFELFNSRDVMSIKILIKIYDGEDD